MEAESKSTLIIDLLMQPRFRILRHAILLMFIFFISSGFAWFLEERVPMITPLGKFLTLILFVIIFQGGCYLNIYVLTPRYLIRNKWGLYFSFLVALVLCVMGFIFLFQELMFKVDDTSEEINYFERVINILSTFLSTSLLFAGTTTFVLFRYWIQNMQQASELQSATLQSELKMLKNQINPHFLFNMLNNANIMIDEDPNIASDILVKLEDLLQYQINDSTQEKVYLRDDINFLTDYLELEKIRRDHFEYKIEKKGDTDSIQVPPLLFITFVENAVKHNSDSLAFSYVKIFFSIEGNKLTFTCENSIPQRPTPKKGGGLGLVNIRRRLDLLYNDNYLLEFKKTEKNYIIYLELSV